MINYYCEKTETLRHYCGRSLVSKCGSYFMVDSYSKETWTFHTLDEANAAFDAFIEHVVSKD